jgi:hypothetical protein
MDCLFVPFHTKASIAKHVELYNVVGTLMDQPHEHELGILVVQNRLKGMELGSQIPQSRQFVHIFKPRTENHRGIHIHILHHKGYQWLTIEWNIIDLESTQLHQ